MKIIADTNVLVRAIVRDDDDQSRRAQAHLRAAQSVVVTLVVLCELVWVLRQAYRHPTATIAAAIRALADVENVVVDREALAAGLAMLDAGGDFADGVIAHEGRVLGGEAFLSFDRQAVALLKAQGQHVLTP